MTVMVFGLQLVASPEDLRPDLPADWRRPFDSTKVVLHYMYETVCQPERRLCLGHRRGLVLIVLLILVLQSLANRFINRRG